MTDPSSVAETPVPLAAALDAAGLTWRAPEPGFEIDGLAPGALSEPASAEEVAGVLRCAGEAGAAVIPVGGGTKLALGNPPSGCDLALSTRKLDRVLEYE